MNNELLNAAKDQAAREGKVFAEVFKDWDDLTRFCYNLNFSIPVKVINRAMEIYAEMRGKEQWNAAIDEAAENVKMVFHDGRSKENKELSYYQSGADNIQISKQSILKLKKP